MKQEPNLEIQFDLMDEALQSGVPLAEVDDKEVAEALEIVQLLQRASTWHEQQHSDQPGPLFTRHVVGRVRKKSTFMWWVGAVAAALLISLALNLKIPTVDEVQVADHVPTIDQVQVADYDPQQITFDHDMLKQAIGADERSEMLQYLSGTERLILALREPELACTPEKVDLASEKKLASHLLLQQKMFASQMDQFEYMHVRDIFRQLETILIEFNTFDGCSDQLEIQSLSDHIIEKKILTKLRLMTHEIQLS